MRLIDADALKQKYFGKRGGLMHTSDIDNAPTIDAEPMRHGHWINDKGLYKCSVCNEFTTIAGFASCIPIEQMNKAMKYCNNCGAKMDEVNDDFNR